MWAAILGFCQSLPELVTLMKKALVSITGYYEARFNQEREDWIANGRRLEAEVLEIKNDEQRAEMARRLAEHRTRMP